MGKLAIRAEGLGKKFRLGERQRYFALRDALTRAVGAPFRMLSRLASGQLPFGGGERKEFWALSDVNFSIAPGEVVGLIGRNGAGKSTLLKILSRITEPTEGYADINGRVGSLLEVGTGFHPELTGRENIFLNGSILGMKRVEIRQKFDEIVAFAEIEKFIDTPVKHYSSGMYVRLAFAVAAHLDPEILLVDEVLAVGDVAFQKKCFGKIGDVAREGRTVLLVSHNIGAVTGLCSKAILIDAGKVISIGRVGDVVTEYLSSNGTSNGVQVWTDAQAPGTDAARLRAVRLFCDDEIASDVRIDKDLFFEVEYTNSRQGAHISVSIHLMDSLGNIVLSTINAPSAILNRDEWAGQALPVGVFKSVCRIPANFLNAGRYSINVLVIADYRHALAQANNILHFSVQETGEMTKEFNGSWIGSVRPRLEWQTQILTNVQS